MCRRPMVYLGDTGKASFRKEMDRRGWGFVLTPERVRKHGRPSLNRPFVLDNGAFSAWINGVSWDSDLFLRAVDFVLAAGKEPDFVVLPDLVAGGELSLEISLRWIDRLPAGWSKALASQDGIPPHELVLAMKHPAVSVWFLGGTNAHKVHAKDYCEAAHRLGKKFHFARCSTIDRLDWAARMGADSVDTVNALNDLRRFRQYMDTWENGHPQKMLPEVPALEDDPWTRECPECGVRWAYYCRCGEDG